MSALRFATALAGLLLGVTPATAALRVVTTTTDLADVARAVGGDLVEVSSIASGTQDAHVIEARPSTMLVARKADLLVEVGMELEIGWLPRAERSMTRRLRRASPITTSPSASCWRQPVIPARSRPEYRLQASTRRARSPASRCCTPQPRGAMAAS